MTLVIDLSPEVEARLQTAARREGIGAVDLARRTLAEHLPPLPSGDRTLALFAEWEAEDATEDAEELAARNREWEERKTHLNTNRAATGEEALFP